MYSLVIFVKKIQAFYSDKRCIFIWESRYFQHVFSCISNEKYRIFTEIIHVKL